MSSAVVPELRRTADVAPGRTLAVVAASTVLTLAAFVTPLATGVRTAADLGTGPAGQAWLLSAMSVGLAAALLVAGVAADDLGQRRVFAGGLALLGVGAGITALAGGAAGFVAGRLVEGGGGAAGVGGALGLLSPGLPARPRPAPAGGPWGAGGGAGGGLRG